MPRKTKEDYIQATSTPGGKVDNTPTKELHELETSKVQTEIVNPEKWEVRLLQDDGTKRVLLLPKETTTGDVVGKNKTVLAVNNMAATLGFETSKVDKNQENFLPALGIAALKFSVQDAISELLSAVTKIPKAQIEGRLDSDETIAALKWYFYFFNKLYPSKKKDAPDQGDGESEAKN